MTSHSEGPPTSTFECLEADAKTEQSWKGTVSFGAIKLDPTAYATLFISFSVIFQCFTFISVAAVGDHGGNRKFLFVIFSTLGAITTICRSKSSLATENLLENTDGGTPTPAVFFRGGSLLPSIYADARYIDAVVVSKAALS